MQEGFGDGRLTVPILELLKRAMNGPLIEKKKFLLNLNKRTNELVKNYGIVYDSSEMIPKDQSIADDLFEAGMELLCDVGLYCEGTSRIVKLDSGEIKESLRQFKCEYVRGEGGQQVTYKKRKAGGDRTPMRIYSPSCVGVSEEVYLPLHISFAKEPVDELAGGVLNKMDGVPIKVGTPLEILAAARQSRWLRDAIRLAGKPGLPISTDSVVTSPMGLCGCYIDGGADRWYDHRFWDFLEPELVLPMTTLNKIALANVQGNSMGGVYMAILYGYGGGVEATAVLDMAGKMAIAATGYGLDQIGSSPVEVGGKSNGKELWWIESAVDMAFSGNSNVINYSDLMTESGICTNVCFYETAARVIAVQAAGCTVLQGPYILRGGDVDRTAGLEARWVRAVADAVTGMNLVDSNELCRTVYRKFEPNLKNPPRGKKFQECYNVRSIDPSEEYLEIFRSVKKELEEIGVPFKY